MCRRPHLLEPGERRVADCSTGPTGQISAVTDMTGTATQRIAGGSRNTGSGGAADGFKCARIIANGVILGDVHVGSFDQNGVGGVNPVDVALWLSDAFDDAYEGRSDFNCSRTVDPADLSLLNAVSLGSGSPSSCGAYCN